jgi:hypothetical protein
MDRESHRKNTPIHRDGGLSCASCNSVACSTRFFSPQGTARLRRNQTNSPWLCQGWLVRTKPPLRLPQKYASGAKILANCATDVFEISVFI